ncbi:MAG: DUF6093 family protein [Actinomycetia bacterium]|nr:DUF6093 family protein [Actinomycetes bacterium]
MTAVPLVRAWARQAAEARMLDTCEAYVDGQGEAVRDPETGTVTYPERRRIYGPGIEPHHGKCRVRMSQASASIMQSSGGSGNEVMILNAIVLPADVALPIGADVTILTSDNPAAVGQHLTIRAPDLGSQKSSNRPGFEQVV